MNDPDTRAPRRRSRPPLVVAEPELGGTTEAVRRQPERPERPAPDTGLRPPRPSRRRQVEAAAAIDALPPRPLRSPRPLGSQQAEGDLAGNENGVIPIFASPLVPAQRVAGRTLIVVVAIMTFLATITLGAMTVVRAAADNWQSDIAAEMTVQLKPVEGVAPSQQIDQTIAALRDLPGIGEVRALSVRETATLLEPWIGAGVELETLPVPRLVLVGIGDRNAFDPAAVRAAVEAIPGAALDDHRAWGEELATTARVVTAVGLVLVALMLVALVISVVFATRAAMASNAQTIEVLHFCGAHTGFIARQFERRFLLLGLAGGAIGGGAAILVFAALTILARFGSASIGGQQARLLFGTPEVGLAGYVAAVSLVAAVGLIAAITTRLAVHSHLNQLD